MRRRRLLATAPGLACGLLAGCDEPAASAFRAWDGPPGDLGDPRLTLLAWAMLAPSACNAQPWRAALPGTDRIELWPDPARLLPASDPNGRQGRIALGCFVEIVALAATAGGLRAELASPAEDALDMRLTAAGDVAPDPLFAALPIRRTSGRAFDIEKPVTAANAAALAQAAGPAVAVGFAVEPEPVAALRRLAAGAQAGALALPAVAAEHGRWLRLGAEQVDAHGDGIALTGPAVWWARRLGLASPRQLAIPGSPAAWVVGLFWDNLFAGTASFGWIASAGDGPADRLRAGRAYQRLDLAAASLGVAIHPVSEALGDVPDLAPARLELEPVAGVRPPARVQMLFRLGYAGPEPPSPRRPLQSIIVDR